MSVRIVCVCINKHKCKIIKFIFILINIYFDFILTVISVISILTVNSDNTFYNQNYLHLKVLINYVFVENLN